MNAISIVIRMYSYKVLKRDGEKMLVISLNPNTTPSQVPWTVGKKRFRENDKRSAVFARQNTEFGSEHIFNSSLSSKAFVSC